MSVRINASYCKPLSRKVVHSGFLWQKLTYKYLVLLKLRQSQHLLISGPLLVVVLLATLLPCDSTSYSCVGAEKEGEWVAESWHAVPVYKDRLEVFSQVLGKSIRLWKSLLPFLGPKFWVHVILFSENSFRKNLTGRQNPLRPSSCLLDKQKPAWASKSQSWACEDWWERYWTTSWVER